MGLAIARQIARAPGGDLTVSSEPGHGATFTADIPRDAGLGMSERRNSVPSPCGHTSRPSSW
ncbi:ATP-binding protein [Dactylosporangium sp. CA-233914]|uniref:ATP-binding protein n=1 Tax=Dactylosporangium sp. CA-233914 TaxID=3239934 RepID=UPI003D8F38AA